MHVTLDIIDDVYKAAEKQAARDRAEGNSLATPESVLHRLMVKGMPRLREKVSRDDYAQVLIESRPYTA